MLLNVGLEKIVSVIATIAVHIHLENSEYLSFVGHSKDGF